jgi:hypothetical protein
MADRRRPQVAAELGDQLEIAFAVFVARLRRQEVARIGQAVRADRAQVRQAQQGAEVLADIAARRAVRQATGKRMPRGITAISCGSSSSRPSSVAMCRRPCCGTTSSSPSAE